MLLSQPTIPESPTYRLLAYLLGFLQFAHSTNLFEDARLCCTSIVYQNPLAIAFQNIKVNLVSQSDTIKTSTPCNHTISFKYNFANFHTGFVVFTGKKWADLVIQFTITQMESQPSDDFHNPDTKSIITSSHFHVGISYGCNIPPGL